MRINLSLYIAGQLADLDQESFILFNYTMEDLSNPTIVRNSFSKSVTLKGTANNNKIFGDIFRLDRKTIMADGYVGAEFDVSRKTPFTIYNEQSEIVESGYLKLNSVARTTFGVEYKVTLYGGLGSFFQNLMFHEDGSKKSLADLKYRNQTGNYIQGAGDLYYGGWYSLMDMWAYLAHPDEYDFNIHDIDWCNVVNFAPCYNGVPEEFSADKAVCYKAFDNVPDNAGIDGSPCSFKHNTQSNLMVMSNPHTEWELRDLRWYLQRPVISVRAIFDAISNKDNNGGFSVTLDEGFFNIHNKLYWNGWITLPLIKPEDRKRDDAIIRLMKASRSPAEYAIGFAKLFGLIFLYNAGERSISIMRRSKFYSMGEVIDLTDRIGNNKVDISPLLAQSRLYQFGSEIKSEWAEQYKKDYGRDYAIQVVNTGNEFSTETQVLTKDFVLKDAVEVQERSLLFFTNELSRDESGHYEEHFALPRYESVTLQMWTITSGEQEMKEYEVTAPMGWKRFPYNFDYPLCDLFPKVQFHEADNKASDGADVLLVFNGMVTTPKWEAQGMKLQLEYFLTDDTPDMEVLNEGVPCWNFTQTNRRYITELPSFRRCFTHVEDNVEVIDATCEWGEPYARGVNGISHKATPATLFNEWWKKYLTDRYNVDTFKMTCKVNLRGLSVNQGLMKNFFYYQGAIFALNAIKNHSLTTLDDTECEFIKVQDIDNYRQ